MKRKFSFFFCCDFDRICCVLFPDGLSGGTEASERTGAGILPDHTRKQQNIPGSLIFQTPYRLISPLKELLAWQTVTGISSSNNSYESLNPGSVYGTDKLRRLISKVLLQDTEETEKDFKTDKLDLWRNLYKQ